MKRKLTAIAAALFLLLGLVLAVLNLSPSAGPVMATEASEATSEGPKAKYAFFFIGDGMSHAQVNAAQVARANNTPGEVTQDRLNFANFEVNGIATTYDATSFAPDSASTASSYASGIKTHSGTIGLEVDRVTRPTNLTEIFRDLGKSIGIVSTVTINHATPAAFYAAVENRGMYYEIAEQMAASGYNYFAGGTIAQPTGKEKDRPDMFGVLEEAGYKIVNTKDDILALSKEDDKVYAVTPVTQDSGSMPYDIDRAEDELKLADFVKKGIDVMSDNENGFFMMVESGKIDWACHANDAKAAIGDVYQLEEAVQVAIDFAAEHPGEVLIVVTGDHETGGLSIGQAGTGYSTAFDLLAYQNKSYVAFDQEIKKLKEENENLAFADVMPLITESFGLVPESSRAEAADERLVLTAYEYDKLLKGFEASKLDPEVQSAIQRSDMEQFLLYGGYDPLSVSLTHILNNKAGIGWTSYAHTGTPVPFFATGAGAENFGGSFDNTDVYQKFIASVG